MLALAENGPQPSDERPGPIWMILSPGQSANELPFQMIVGTDELDSMEHT